MNQQSAISNQKSIPIIAEGADWLVVDKPPFLQAHPSKPDGSFTLWHALREILAYELANGGQVSLVNRLDRETSGLTLIATTAAAARRFGMLMAARAFHKEYLAIVRGWPEWDEREIDAPLLRQGEVAQSRIYLKQCVHPQGVAARTLVRVERRLSVATTNGDRFSLVRALPQTGRMHQIRVHLAHAGHSLIGDKIYGPDEGCYLRFIETGWTPELERVLLLPRHALHAAVLAVPSEGLTWSAPLPDDLEKWLSKAADAAA